MEGREKEREREREREEEEEDSRPVSGLDTSIESLHDNTKLKQEDQ